MGRYDNIKRKWDDIIVLLSKRFGSEDGVDLDKIIYLIGLQEIGCPDKSFKKDDKINLMHIAICTLLEPYGYYEFKSFDENGWPHFRLKEVLPALSAGEQTLLMKEAIVEYFSKKEIIK